MDPGPLFDWCDSRSWQPLVVATRGTRMRHRGIATLLPRFYAGVVFYHGCRPTDVGTYYRNGLMRADADALQAAARAIYSPERLPEITDEVLSAAIAKLGRRDDGRIYVSLDRRDMIESCSHYMRYGSEYLTCVGAALSGRGQPDYRQVLQTFGTPTLLRVAVEWDRLGVSDFDDLARSISRTLPSLRWSESVPIDGFSAVLFDDISATCVLSHEHPELGRDLLAY